MTKFQILILLSLQYCLAYLFPEQKFMIAHFSIKLKDYKPRMGSYRFKIRHSFDGVPFT